MAESTSSRHISFDPSAARTKHQAIITPTDSAPGSRRMSASDDNATNEGNDPWWWTDHVFRWRNVVDDSLYSNLKTAKPPSKDVVQLYISADTIVLRVFPLYTPTQRKQSVQKGALQPFDQHCTYSELLDDQGDGETIKEEIVRYFGDHELQYIENLLRGHIDYIMRVPRKILLKIMFNLDIIAIAQLSRVCSHFREVTSCDSVWSRLFLKQTTNISQEVLMVVDQSGWKQAYKIFKPISADVKKQVAIKKSPSQESSASGRRVSIKGSTFSTKKQGGLQKK